MNGIFDQTKKLNANLMQGLGIWLQKYEIGLLGSINLQIS